MGLLDPSSDTTCKLHLPFWFPVHRLHWSCHSLSPPVPLPSVIRPPDQCRPRTPYPLLILHSPCPQLTPYLPASPHPPPPIPQTPTRHPTTHPHPPTIPPPPHQTHKTPPTLTHWWFSTWGAQPCHPTDGCPPIMHQPTNLHLPTP